MTFQRRAFTLLEVVIALGILATSLMVLVDSQATAVFSTTEADRFLTATSLAEEKMVEVQLLMEREGFSEMDIEEDGDFEDFGAEEFRGDDLHLEIEDQLDDYKWAYAVRKVELSIPPDIGGMAGDLAASGYYGDDKAGEFDEGGAPDLGDMGISPDMVSEYLGPYIREARVLVWWGDNEDETDQVELVTHIINPTGSMMPGGGFSGLSGGGAAGAGGGNNGGGQGAANGGGNSGPSNKGRNSSRKGGGSGNAGGNNK